MLLILGSLLLSLGSVLLSLGSVLFVIGSILLRLRIPGHLRLEDEGFEEKKPPEALVLPIVLGVLCWGWLPQTLIEIS